MIRHCVASVPGERIRANYVSYLYGCSAKLSDVSSPCSAPLEVQTWPACERTLADYEAAPGVPYPHRNLGRVEGVPAAFFDLGTRLELYTGTSTVVIFGSDRTQVLRAARGLQREAGGQAPGVPSSTTPRGARLQPPVPGAVSGRLSCTGERSGVAKGRAVAENERGATTRGKNKSNPFKFGFPFSLRGICDGDRAAPISAVFYGRHASVNRTSHQIARDTNLDHEAGTGDETDWVYARHNHTWSCHNSDHGQATTTALDVPRYHTRLWRTKKPRWRNPKTIATPHYEITMVCGKHVSDIKHVVPAGHPSGYDRGRRKLKRGLKKGGHHVHNVYWGNTANIHQCHGKVNAGSNGNVAFIRLGG